MSAEQGSALDSRRRARIVAATSDDPAVRAAVDAALVAWEREPVGSMEDAIMHALVDTL